MKLKSSAIAVAVAGALGASMAAHAASDSGFYADLRIGFQNTDTGGTSELQIQNQVSRFGFRGTTDMGNGLTGFGRMEFGLNTESDNSDPLSRRHAYVGLRGDWGEVKLGQTYHTFYTMITGPLDNPMLGTASNWLGYTGRTAQAITYSGDWGIFSLGATGYFDDSSTDSAGKPNDLDLFELAGAFQAGPIKLALGAATGQEDAGVDVEPLIGLTASGWQTGMFTWGLGYTQQDAAGTATTDQSSIVFDVLIGNGYFHYEQLETKGGKVGGGDSTGTGLTLGYAQPLGRQTSMYYEYETIDNDEGKGSNSDETENITVALRYKWN
jgi:predicted porin